MYLDTHTYIYVYKYKFIYIHILSPPLSRSPTLSTVYRLPLFSTSGPVVPLDLNSFFSSSFSSTYLLHRSLLFPLSPSISSLPLLLSPLSSLSLVPLSISLSLLFPLSLSPPSPPPLPLPLPLSHLSPHGIRGFREPSSTLQGFLAHKKLRPGRTLP